MDRSPKGQEYGTLHHTYHAALQYDHDEPDADDLVLGVVRKPMYGIQALVDENWDALAPPADLLAEFKERADEIGHNPAIAAVDYRARYRSHLTGDDQQAAIDAICSELRSGRDVWLVCFENTDETYCHRLLLADEIRDRLSGVPADEA